MTTTREQLAAEATRRRASILRLIREHLAEKGYAPSVSEITRATGVASTLTTRRDLDVLAEEGKIERDAKVARGIRLLV